MTAAWPRVAIWGVTVATLALLFWVPSAAPQLAAVRFENVTESSGLTAGLAEEWGMLAIADYDNDGWDDLYVGHHGIFGMGGVMGSLTWPRGGQLFHNAGNGTFTDQTGLLPLVTEETEHRHQAVWCDLNRDGYEDLIIGTGFDGDRDAVGNRDLWLRNEAGKGFTEIAQSLGTEDWHSKVYALTCFDADRNGWLDVLTLQAPQPAIGPGQLHHLWMNSGGRFAEEANKRGLVMPANQAKRPYAIDCVDFNESGWPSCIGTGNNYTYWLLNTGGRFRALTGVYEPIADLSPYLHDAAWADFNGDGRLDVAIVDTFDARGNSVLKVHCNNGARVTDVGHADGLRNCWDAPIAHQVNFSGDPRSLAVGDFDNDGSPDMFLTHEGGLVIQGQSAKGPDYLFMNTGSGTFIEVAGAAGLAGPVGTREGGGGAAVIDYDRDGRLDLVVGYNALYAPGPFRLYRNVTTNGNSWVGFVLRGPQILGASVQVQACGRTWHEQVTARTGWLAQDSRNVHVGLGRCAGPVSVTVHWPGGQQTTASVAAGSYYLLSSAGPAPTPLPPANGARAR